MRTAITKGTLRIPPTYFALAHADAMPDIEWRAFTLVADIADPTVAVPVEQATPLAGRLGTRVRERLKWGRLGAMSSTSSRPRGHSPRSAPRGAPELRW